MLYGIVLPTLEHKIQATAIPTAGLPEVPRLCSHSSSASFGSWWSWWSQWNYRTTKGIFWLNKATKIYNNRNTDKCIIMIYSDIPGSVHLTLTLSACLSLLGKKSFVPGWAPDQPRPALVATPPTPLVRGKGSKIPARPNDQRPGSRSSADAPRKIPSSRWGADVGAKWPVPAGGDWVDGLMLTRLQNFRDPPVVGESSWRFKSIIVPRFCVLFPQNQLSGDP